MKTSVENKIVVGFTISVLALAGVGWLSYYTDTKLIHAEDWVTHTYKVIATEESGRVILTDAETAQRGYLHHRGKFAGHPNGHPVVVLLDLKMPKVDGLEVLRQMRAEPELKHVPVVMITSSREEQNLVRSYQLGVNAYVVKPMDFQQFVESIKQIGFFWAIVNEPPPGTMKRS